MSNLHLLNFNHVPKYRYNQIGQKSVLEIIHWENGKLSYFQSYFTYGYLYRYWLW